MSVVAVIDPAELMAPWREFARCRGVDPSLFFPERGESTEPAKAICEDCPVREPCVEYALARTLRHGVWGSTSERERRRERHQRMRERVGLPRLADRVDPRDELVAALGIRPEYAALFHRPRSARRASFGSGSAASRRIARAAALASTS